MKSALVALLLCLFFFISCTVARSPVDVDDLNKLDADPENEISATNNGGGHDGTLCDVCNFLVQNIDRSLIDNATDAEIKQLLLEGCDLFSAYPDINKECDKLVNDWIDALLFIVEEEVDKDRVCDGLSFCIVNTKAPRFVHLALHPDPTRMTVSWFTYEPTPYPGVNLLATAKGPVLANFSATTETYYQPGGYSHHAILTGLKPATTYYYLAGDDAGGWTSPVSFTTAPAANAPRPFTIAVYGDMGVHNSQNTHPRITALAKNGSLDWVYHIGDIGYGDDYPANIYEYVWNEWFKRVEAASSHIPYMTCPGNHEYSCEHPGCIQYSAGFTAYNSRFRMPGAESGSNTSMFFSFDYSYAHFISISTETDYPNAPFPTRFGDQLAWLEKDLIAANANRNAQRPWIIVVGHRPIYSSNAQSNGVPSAYAKYLQNYFEGLFHKYKVDLYFAGHEHNYERIWPVYANQVLAHNYNKPASTVYIISGAAGNIEGLEHSGSPPTWSASRFDQDEGFGLLDIGASTLRWTFYGSSDGAVHDQIVITAN